MKKLLFTLIWIFIFTNTYANWTYDDATYLAKKSLIVVSKTKVDELYQAGSRTKAVNILFSTWWLDYTKYNNTLSWLVIWTWVYVKSDDYKYYMLKKSYDPYQVKAKLFLLFEDIFSVDIDRNKDITIKDIEDTHNLIYKNMFWSYKTLIKKILYNWDKWDYAISKYLDLLNQTNPKSPNENYSRELLQLFLMWKYKVWESFANWNTPNYTEKEINNFWKILVWFKTIDNHKVIYDNSINTNNYIEFLTWNLLTWDSFPFYSWWKIDVQELKKSINWNNWLPDNIIDYIFSKRQKAISLFLADKLFRFYVWENWTKDELNEISNKIIQEKFEILPVVKWLLTSNMFYNHENDILFKNPIELIWNITKLFWVKKYYILDDLSNLNWYAYHPGTIFGRAWFDNNKLFFTPSIWLAWTYVSKDFARQYAYNIFSGSVINLTNFISNNSIFSWYPFIKNKTRFDSNDVKYITGYIDLKDLSYSWWLTLTWWRILLWQNKISIDWHLYSYDSFKIDYKKMEIYLSWTNNNYTWSIDFLNMIRWYTPEEIISYFESKLYINSILPDATKNKIINFLTTDSKWDKVKFDSQDKYKIFGVIRILLNQPEYILKSWYKDKTIVLSQSKTTLKLNDNKLILFRLGWGFDPLSIYWPKDEYNRYKVLRSEWALLENEITDFGSWYYINKTYTGFINLMNNKDLYVVNRIWVPNHSRWHDFATYQMASLDASQNKEDTKWILWSTILNKTNIEDWIVISPYANPAIFRGWKYLGIWSLSYVYKNDDKTKTLLENIFSDRLYPSNLKLLYNKMLLINNVSNNLYKKTWKYSYNWSKQSKFDYIKELLNQNLWKIISVPIFGGYDVHSDAKTRMQKVFSEVVSLVSNFYNQVKDNQNVTIVLYSEFWRTFKLNTTKWVDHGNWWTMFIITNNKKLKDNLKTNFLWNMDFVDSKYNWFGVWIDNRAVWKTILKSLYSIDISNQLNWNIYLSGYLSKTFGNISNFNRTLRDRYGHIDFKFNLDNQNFIPTEASYLKLEYGQDPNNLFEESQWKLKYYWNNVCRWKTDLWKCKVALHLNNILPEKKYYYKITLFDNQYNKKVLSWSFVSSKTITNWLKYNILKDVNSYFDEFYNWITWTNLTKKIYLSESWTTILTWEWNKITALSGTYIDSIETFSWVKWKGWFVLPTDLNPDLVLNPNLEFDWKNIKTLKIWKLLKVGSDIQWVKMLLNKWVNIILDGLDTNKKYKLYTSEDLNVWNTMNWLIKENWKYKIKTNHFSYYLLLETDNNWDLLNSDKNNNKNTSTVETTNKNRYSGWGWGPIFIKDNCPYWDYSKSYYDKTCGYDPYYEWSMSNVKDSMIYMNRKFKMDLQKYSDKDDDKFNKTISYLVNIKEFDKISENILSKLIKTKYIWNYKLLYLKWDKYKKVNVFFEKIAKNILSKDYKRNSIKTRLIDNLDSIIIYFSIYLEDKNLRKMLKPIILKRMLELKNIYNSNLKKKMFLNKTNNVVEKKEGKIIKSNLNNKKEVYSIWWKNINYEQIKKNIWWVDLTKKLKTNLNKYYNQNTDFLYKVNVKSIKLKKDPYWKITNAWLYYWDIVEQMTLLHKKWFFKVKVINSKDSSNNWKKWYIFLKYLKK